MEREKRWEGGKVGVEVRREKRWEGGEVGGRNGKGEEVGRGRCGG